ncbi:hypothetical protein BS47DRAFT_1398000 [Hydnum rufescens UP504]|uniref:Zn(2)-C6 fungal-type domain-containing protein n=1 Tax=Hydnum rufescens UP504 TaxID=1448309 RepID=A0A9P6DS03_9AGAM|nr:hypothetical protein BS47DRAFT_1398000 [Hydnum rufescens UP504]
MPHEGAYLQRGNACLNCRRRKQRCDGGRPACRKCIHYKRASQCAYNDEKRLTRVQVLESRLQQLEGLIQMQNTSQDDAPSLDKPTPATSSHPRPGNSLSPYETDYSIPKRIADHLLVVFFQHLYHYNFPISIPRFRSIIDLPMTDARRPHPVLLNAIFILACQHTRESDSFQYREAFRARAYSHLEDKASHRSRPLDFILGISLIARSSLNVGDIHRARELAGNRFPLSRLVQSLDSPANALELTERINLWWCVYLIDRDTSSESGIHSSITDENILGPYETNGNPIQDVAGNTATITSLYDSAPNNRATSIHGDVVLAVRVKATALLDRSRRLASNVASRSIDVTSPAFAREFLAVDQAVTRFRQSLPTCITQPYPRGAIIDTEMEDIYLCSQQAPGELGFLCYTVSMAHIYSLGAILHLHGLFSAGSETHRAAVVRAAKDLGNIVVEIDFVDSSRIHASVGSRTGRPAPQLVNLAYVDVLLPRLRSLAKVYPGLGEHACPLIPTLRDVSHAGFLPLSANRTQEIEELLE